MARTELTCDKIGDLDGGRARGIINAALAAILSDLEDRGEDEKERILKMEVRFKLKDGMMTSDVKAQPKIPSFQTGKTHVTLTQKAKKGGAGGVRPALEFQEHDPENADQDTFKSMDG